ncbi:MAG: putative lipid II flippase FtsW [Alphaproteobacteria bacterium]|nr:putative lipid II flippase FtsW [Alphaproteobacteria bacterium]
MSTTISRNDRSLMGQWWWTVDRWLLGSVCLLMVLGLLMSFAASPSVASTLNINPYYFVIRHTAYLIPSMLCLVAVSLSSPRNIRRIALILFLFSVGLVLMTLFFGVEIKGARRWISFAGTSIQPSELLKPGFAIITAWMLSEKRLYPEFPGALVSFLVYIFSISLLLMQPDLGMVVLLTLVWFSQLFLAGLSMVWVFIAGGLGVGGLGLAYLFLPHVTKRIDQFFNGDGGDRFGDKYQITQSLEAFMSGGFMGQGPGEGVVKRFIPDAHADFVFAVAAEEFGFIFCAFLIFIFLFVVIRSLLRVFRQDNLFAILAVGGLVLQFGLQALINIASTLNLIPTKGMTLPFLSYGGSSILTLAISMGMVLALTRHHYSGERS